MWQESGDLEMISSDTDDIISKNAKNKTEYTMIKMGDSPILIIVYSVLFFTFLTASFRRIMLFEI